MEMAGGEEEAADEWLIQSLRMYEELHTFELQAPTRVIEWARGNRVCVAGYEDSGGNEILQLLPPPTLQAKETQGLCPERDFKVECGAFSNRPVYGLKHVPDTSLLVTSGPPDSSLRVWQVSAEDSDVIKPVGAIAAENDAGQPWAKIATISAKAPWVLHGSRLDSVRVTEVESRKNVYTAASRTSEELSDVAFLDRNTALLCCAEGQLSLADVRQAQAPLEAASVPWAPCGERWRMGGRSSGLRSRLPARRPCLERGAPQPDGRKENLGVLGLGEMPISSSQLGRGVPARLLGSCAAGLPCCLRFRWHRARVRHAALGQLRPGSRADIYPQRPRVGRSGQRRRPVPGDNARVAPAETQNRIVSGERRFPARLGVGSALREAWAPSAEGKDARPAGWGHRVTRVRVTRSRHRSGSRSLAKRNRNDIFSPGLLAALPSPNCRAPAREKRTLVSFGSFPTSRKFKFDQANVISWARGKQAMTPATPTLLPSTSRPFL
ncbi:Wdr73 isoform A [Columba livia]|nr:Wdr73 isoform A [Columba livia]